MDVVFDVVGFEHSYFLGVDVGGAMLVELILTVELVEAL